MELVFNPFSVTLIATSLLVGGLSLFIAIRLKGSTRWVALTMLFATIWGFFYGFELASSTLEQMLFWIKLEYLGISFFGAFWLIFTLKYTGHKSLNGFTLPLLILLIPTITLILVWTNDLHHLHYTNTELINQGTFPLLKITKGPWYLVHTVYSYAAFLIGTFVLWKRFRFADPLYLNQTKLLIAAGLFPLIFNIFYQFGIIQPLGGIDLTPYAFLFTYLIISFAILKFNLFSIKPIAQNKIMEIITRGVLVFDSHNQLIDFNPAAKNFFSTNTKCKVGISAKSLFKNKREELLELLQNREQKTITIHTKGEANNSTVQVESIPILDKNSIFNGMLLLFEDITEQVQTNERLIKQAEDLQQLNELKDKFFSIISHDLKGPVFGVKELIHMTQTGMVSKDEFLEMLPEVSKNMEQVAILLENLLAWASSQLRGEVIDPTPFDIMEVLNQQKNLLSRIALEKKILIDLKPQERILVYADKNMIDLVLRNLISNAIKFSKSGDKVELSAELIGNQVKICVKDKGMGISSENLQKLSQGVSFTTRGLNNESGTGLGLILVREYIRKNKGSMDIKSEIGMGTTFCVFLPKATSN
ncbi:histidine kinase N-terminal 7TM domain-containing protein [Algoriphagus sp. CAU 1675]|uniref:sensor histidine kinase n=1 Tax=Algoriphagus sp. CAU 1675 TaxID=3032597 RepID=UPI0023DAB448|nr:histidine kinase N-terminal 7TM domain-containing protein [Algoriphagus sp. CAU 1675]MDF2158170.1 histidine kinase N-terminal 7TM domain-containing protein [Algoriphagus sp. CAU 1675]